MNRIVIKSTITGIHKTKISSHEDVNMRVEEYNGIPDIDPDCMRVMFPSNVDAALLDEVVWLKNPQHKRFRDLKVRQCLGKEVGNVPANVAGLFRRLLQEKKVSSITWYVIQIFSYTT